MGARSVITVGNFDGVHLGHRALVTRARRLADPAGAHVVAISFQAHPLTVLRPGAAPPLLATPEEKRHWLLEAGADQVELLQPTPALLSQSPQAFISEVVQRHRPLAFVEGPDFRFGKDRAGDLDLLEAFGRQMDFHVERMPRLEMVLCDQLQTPVNSSLVRWLLAQGRVADAARGLGRPYSLRATVVKGKQRGRTIGVPTINLDMTELADRVVPGPGVYAGAAELADGSRHAAAISVGMNPTFGGQPMTIEAHLLDFQGDLYQQAVRVEFHRWLRDQQPFPSVEHLRRQLARDIQRTAEHGTTGSRLGASQAAGDRANA